VRCCAQSSISLIILWVYKLIKTSSDSVNCYLRYPIRVAWLERVVFPQQEELMTLRLNSCCCFCRYPLQLIR
jgi:hypothetical protein